MAVNDLRYLAKRMPKYAVALGLDVIAYENEIALAVVAALAAATPVDTGKARSNWLVSVGSEADGTRSAFSSIPSRWRPPHGPGGNMSETRNQAGVVWSANGALKGRTKPEQAVYITNNLPYIDPLNEGHSPQASAGFVQRAIIQGRGTANARFKALNLEKV